MAQSRGANRIQEEEGIEYVEFDPIPPTPDFNRDIYFSEGDLEQCQNPPCSPPAMNHDADASVYDLAGTTGTYIMHEKSAVSQQKQNGTNDYSGWTLATKILTAISVIILIIAIIALALALVAVGNGKIYTTCLLYTSPSPRDATLSRMPSSA